MQRVTSVNSVLTSVRFCFVFLKVNELLTRFLANSPCLRAFRRSGQILYNLISAERQLKLF